MQAGPEYDPATAEHPPELHYDRVEIFPRGGFIYITDEVFEKRPHLALQIVKLFIAKIEKLSSLAGSLSPSYEVVEAYLTWRLCVRPELMEYLYQACNDNMAVLPVQDSNYAR
jgi:chromo domain-containing protein 1